MWDIAWLHGRDGAADHRGPRHRARGSAVPALERTTPRVHENLQKLPQAQRRARAAQNRGVPLCRRFTVCVPRLPALVAGADFSFFGHSNGALVAYACTQRLERLGARLPRHVFLSGKKPPNGPPRRDSELSDPEFVRFLTDLGGMPQKVVANDELIELCLPIIRADMKVGESFRPHGRLGLATPVSVLGGAQDNDTTRETLDGWREFCHSVQRVELLPGDHFFLTQHRDYIADLMKASLAA
ncbi:thioesterase domain-containing protein [Tahibacter sp.]|uniref:thioesterase II family protein n=1 Tax=Tahibacter sp. TaxID=2056211 RepID=UPI0028C3F137|nr:thioesterase domain-containing protein [Tahibacter sp.]